MTRSIHFLGIGGVGMAGVAFLLKARGRAVSGCDLYATPRTRWLEENGISVAIGHDAAHIDASIGELVVTPAVPPDTPELVAARAAGLTVRSRGEVLASLVNAADGIAVCGTHGKTTTATFTTRLLQKLGAHPSWCIGGETGTVPVAGVGTDPISGTGPAILGTGPLVVEADESDGTLALYRPNTLVLNAVDFDHLEHFSSKEDYFDCYRTVIRQTSDTIIVCADHPQALDLVQGVCPQSRVCPQECGGLSPKIVTFGFAPGAQVNAADWPDIPVLGRHNVANALAAIAVALSRGFTREQIAAALPDAVSALPDRRFEQVASSDDVRVYTDYAHHPAELKCAIDMARALHPARLRVLFQPHRYSRTKALCDEFPPAFEAADEVVLAPVYPAFEEPLLGGDIADLYAAFRGQAPQGRGQTPHVLLAHSLDEGWRHLFLTAQPCDVLMLLGAGDIVNLVPRVKEEMSGWKFTDRAWTPLAPHSFFRTGGETCGDGEKVIVGMGSNTWFSDCATDIEIVQVPPDRPAARPGASLLADHPELAFMAGIPGTVGGWAKMNAGAFGDSFGNHVESVEVVLADGSVRTMPAAECGFSYRHSSIPGLITSVTLKPVPAVGAAARPADFLARRKVFPPRTCGSVFKNPPDAPAGKLLEEAGCKSLRVGGAYVWQEHANVIVAGDGCTSSDILALARLMSARVRARFGVVLEPEIRGLVTGDGDSATTTRQPRPQTPETSHTT